MTTDVLFLDIDGVLNSTQDQWVSNHFLKEVEFELSPARCSKHAHVAREWELEPRKIAILNKTCNMLDLKLVLSSTWRKMFDVDEIDNIFAAQFPKWKKGRFLGKTPNLDDGWLQVDPETRQIQRGQQRGTEIAKWLADNTETHKVRNFAILDDDSDFLDGQLPHFVQTNGWIGLTIFDCLALAKVFGKLGSLDIKRQHVTTHQTLRTFRQLQDE